MVRELSMLTTALQTFELELGGDGKTHQKELRTEEREQATTQPVIKTGRYEELREKKQKIGKKPGNAGSHKSSKFNKWKTHNNRKQQAKGPKSELRNVSQIKKIRKKSAKLQEYMEHRRQENLKKKANRASGAKHVGGKRKK
ncbi:hypothetical protein COOONC_11996 [Cooperia oncophora]